MQAQTRKLCEETKTGLPALWEQGGATHNQGHSVIICNSDGSPKYPIYIRTNGHLCNGEHALFVVSSGDAVITTARQRQDFITCIQIIAAIKIIDGSLWAHLDMMAEYSRGEWSSSIFPAHFANAVEAAHAKAEAYHCREPFYLATEPVKLAANQ